MRFLFLFLLLCLFVAAAHADRKVYKCTDANGSAVFSPDPCGKGAQEMKVDVKAPDSPPPVETKPQSKSTAPRPSDAAAAEAPIDADDMKCQSQALRLRTYPSEANLQMLVQRQGDLMRNYAQSASEAVKIQIGNLDNTIAVEQARISEARQKVDRAVADAMAKCDALKAARGKDAGH
jgi:hypothetical protein